jgi:hypothetical protein
MLSVLTFLVPFFAACTEQLPDTDTNGSAASYVPFEGTTTDPALLYNRRFAIEDIKQFETLPERLPEGFFDTDTRYWPAVTDKAYKQAIFEAIKEVIAFVDYLPQSGYDFKRTWGDFRGFSTRFDNWEDWLEDVYRDYDPADGLSGSSGNEFNPYSKRVFFQFVYHHFPFIGLSLESNLPKACRSLLFCESVRIYYIASSDILGRPYGDIVQESDLMRESNFGYPEISRWTNPETTHELYIACMLANLQRLYNAFYNQTDEQIMAAIDDNFDPVHSLWFSGFETLYTYSYTPYFRRNE